MLLLMDASFYADVHIDGGTVHSTLMGYYQLQAGKEVGGRPYFQSGDVYLYYYRSKAEWHIGDQVRTLLNSEKKCEHILTLFIPAVGGGVVLDARAG
jgi:hypothetical protein